MPFELQMEQKRDGSIPIVELTFKIRLMEILDINNYKSTIIVEALRCRALNHENKFIYVKSMTTSVKTPNYVEFCYFCEGFPDQFIALEFEENYTKVKGYSHF